MNLLQRLNRKFGRLSIPHLMIVISAGMAAVFVANLLFPQYGILQLIDLDFAMVRRGQIWRLVSFLLVPPSTSLFWIFFNLYFNCLIGEALEREWGSFCFTTFYLIGTVAAIVAGWITGYGYNTYLNLSLFLAFAMFYPNFQVMVFFFIPIQVKYLALIDLVYFIYYVDRGVGVDPGDDSAVAGQPGDFLRRRFDRADQKSGGVLENPAQLPAELPAVNRIFTHDKRRDFFKPRLFCRAILSSRNRCRSHSRCSRNRSHCCRSRPRCFRIRSSRTGESG